MENLRAEPRQFRGFDVRNPLDHPGAGDEARIARHHAVDVGPDLDLIRADRRADDRGAVIRSATAESRRRSIASASDKSAHDRNEIPFEQRQQDVARRFPRVLHERTSLTEAVVGDDHLLGVDVFAGQCPHHHRVGEKDRRQFLADCHDLVCCAHRDLAEEGDAAQDGVDLVDLLVELPRE